MESIRGNHQGLKDIASASRSQASSLQEVRGAVRLMDEVTQHNAALVEQTNAAIEQTEEQARDLDRVVDAFTLRHASAAAPVHTPKAFRSLPKVA